MERLLEEEAREYALSGGLGMGIIATKPKITSLWQPNCEVEDCICNGNLQPGHPPFATGDITRDFVTDANGNEEETIRGITEVYVLDLEDEPQPDTEKDNTKKDGDTPQKVTDAQKAPEGPAKEKETRHAGSSQDNNTQGEMKGTKGQQEQAASTSGTEDGKKVAKKETKAPAAPEVRRIAQGYIPIASLLGEPLDRSFMDPEPRPAPAMVSPTSAAITLPTPPPSAASDVSYIPSPNCNEAGPSSPRSDNHVDDLSITMEGLDFEDPTRQRVPTPDLMEVDQANRKASFPFPSESLPHPSLPPPDDLLRPPSSTTSPAPNAYHLGGNGPSSSSSMVPDQSYSNQPHYLTPAGDHMEVDQPYTTSITHNTSQGPPLTTVGPTNPPLIPLPMGYSLIMGNHAAATNFSAPANAYNPHLHIPVPVPPPLGRLPPARPGRPPLLQSNIVHNHQFQHQFHLALNPPPNPWGHNGPPLVMAHHPAPPISNPSPEATMPEASSLTQLQPPLPIPVPADAELKQGRRTKRTTLSSESPVAGTDMRKRRSHTVASGSRERSRPTTKIVSFEESVKPDEQDDGEYIEPSERTVSRSPTTTAKSKATPKAKGKFPCPKPGCGKTFTRKNDVRRHITLAAAHRDFELEDEASEARCKKCGRILSRGDSAKRHQLYSACGKRMLPSEQKTGAAKKVKKVKDSDVVQSTSDSQSILLA